MFFYVLVISFLYTVSFYFLGLLLVNKYMIFSVGSDPVRTVAVRYSVGLLLNFLVLLVCRDLTLAGIVYLSLVGLGIVMFYLNAAGEWAVLRPVITDWKNGAPALFLVLYAGMMFGTPLDGWDARSIWFFHAKKLYFDHGLFNALPWNQFGWSHPDYPKLIPFMGAQISFFGRVWNDFLPRQSLLVILVMCLLWLRRIFSDFGRFLLSLLLVLAIGEFAWNGYMDGYLALIYSLCIGILFVILNDGNTEDVIGLVVCLSLISNLKNEGLLLCVCLITGMTLYLATFGRRLVRRFRRSFAILGIFSLMAVFPTIWWARYKKLWAIDNDLGLFSPEFFARILTRADDLFTHTGSIVLATLLSNFHIYFALAILIVLLTIGKSFVKKQAPWFLISVLSLLLYYFGIFLIYFGTPMDLHWHLATSASRTTMPLWLSMAMMLLIFFDKRERPGVLTGD